MSQMKTGLSGETEPLPAEVGRSGRSTTIRDIGRLAGVSPGTVSRAIHNSPLVNSETCKRIMALVEELDYRPNLAARRLVLGRTLTIALIAPFFTHPAVNRQLDGVVHTLAQSEYEMVIRHVGSAADRARSFVHFPGKSQVDGVLLLSVGPKDDEMTPLQKAGVPIVFVGALDPGLSLWHHVSVDHVAAGRAATHHLIELGHRLIGFLGDSTDQLLNVRGSREMHDGYRQALQEAGIDPSSALIREGLPDWKEAERLAGELLSLPDRPTALVAAGDIQAAGALKAAATLGIPVPDRLSIVGSGDIEPAEILGLTTLRQPLFTMGAAAVELLLEAIEDPAMEPVNRVLPTELIRRLTTGPAPA